MISRFIGRQDPRFHEARFAEERIARTQPFARAAREAGGIAASSTLGAARHANPFLASRHAALASSRAAAPILARRAEVEQQVVGQQMQQIAAEREAERQRADRMLGVALSTAGAVGGTLLQAMPAIMRPGQPPVQSAAPSPLSQLGAEQPGQSAMQEPPPVAAPAVQPPGRSRSDLRLAPPDMVATPQRTSPTLGTPQLQPPMQLGSPVEHQLQRGAAMLGPPTAAFAAGPTVFPSDIAAPASPTASAILADPGIPAATDQIAVPPPPGYGGIGPAGMAAPGMLQSATTPGSPGAIPERRGPDIGGMIGGLAPALTAIPGVGPALGVAAGLGGSAISAVDEEERRRRMLGR